MKQYSLKRSGIFSIRQSQPLPRKTKNVYRNEQANKIKQIGSVKFFTDILLK